MKITTKQLKQLIREAMNDIASPNETNRIEENNPLSGPTMVPKNNTRALAGAGRRSDDQKRKDVLSGQTAAGTYVPLRGDDNKKLAIIAKELQILLNKIKKELQ